MFLHAIGRYRSPARDSSGIDPPGVNAEPYVQREVSCGSTRYPVQATDFREVRIRWERRGYETHVRKRPETAGWHEAIARTLREPEVVAELRGGAWAYHRRGVLPARHGSLYLLVVVRWHGVLGDIATAFATDRIKHFARLVMVNK